MRLPVCCCLLLLVAGIRGQDEENDDFNLEDAFGPNELKPTLKPHPGEGGPTPDILGGFDFDDHAGGVDIPKKPTPKPQPGGGDSIPKKPTPKTQPGGGDAGEFDLGDALGGGDDGHNNPANKPQPGQGGGGGGGGRDIGDGDLGELGPEDPRGHDDNPSGADGQGQGEGNQSVLAGVISAVAVAAVGAVSSFIAYQKKKLCFKGNADDPENVNMDGHKVEQSEPQAQSTLLAK
ncbi:CD99 antigen isoform X2 [Bufo gargarizans]|uniref:CD99 antigen isoform X2 n=1 Tax=Bufo gargarizans TaxID=30331 RepID=UPI001CF1AC9C|nr:CD99 antigen isoform X2 [Bufo gargarizans]